MAEQIDSTIFRLSIDGSAYVEGVDKVSASTQKLSAAQEAANTKLNQLKETTRLLKEEIKGYNATLKEQDKAVSAAQAKLNLLNSLSSKNKDAVAAATKELQKQTLVRNQLTEKISATNVALNNNNLEVTKQAKVFRDAGKSSDEFTAGLGKIHSGLSRVASLIPGLGIGGLIAIISGPVINAFSEWASSIDSINQKQKLLSQAFAEGDYQKAVKDVSLLTLNIKLAQQGFLDKTEVLKQYNDTLGKSLGQVKSLDEAEDALVKKGPAYVQMTLLKAAANLALDKAAKQAVDAAIALQESQEKVATITKKGESERDKATGAAGLSEFLGKGIQQEAVAAKKESDKGIETLKNIAESFQRDAAEIAKQFGINFEPITPTKIKAGSLSKQITNIYEQELQKLKADIAKLDQKGFTDEVTITKAVEEDFKKRALAFDKAFKNKQLTATQVSALKGYLDNLQKLTLDQNLKSFREQKDAYLKQISAELENLQFEEATKRIATIQDRFERERQMIIAEADKTVNALQDKRDKLIGDITKNAAKNGLTPADIAPQIESIKILYGKLFDDLMLLRDQRLQQLSFETFERLSEDAKRLLDSGNLGVSEGSLVNIKATTKLFLEGKISYEKYQKELTAIARFEVQERFRLQKLFLEAEIKVREEKLKSDKALTADQVKRLQDEITRLRQQLTDAEKGNQSEGARNKKTDDDERIQKIVEYTQALGALAESVIGFWAKANEAEQKALDRSISLQEKRVDAAQRIASRGNAQYLKAEEDRLNELQVKRENAARKQLAINAALQGSEILVALVSGVAQGAKIGGPLGAIVGLTALAAAIAGAFALAESLKPDTPSFFKGTKDTGPGGKKDNKGGFTATLHPNEAVIPADKNKAYKPTIEAIYDGKISPERLNNFVKNLNSVKNIHNIQAVPKPNYVRMKEWAESNNTQAIKTQASINEQNKKLDELIELNKQSIRTMKNLGVNVSLDQHGFAVTQMEVIEQLKRDKRV